jgi:hypothetical protein
MSAVQEQEAGIIRDATLRSIGAGGTPADALASSARPDAKLWKHAVDEMLGWTSRRGQFDADDEPDRAILETAIDYAVDQIECKEGDPAPASSIPSGSGRIAMEWNEGPITVIIEFIALGRASYTTFNCGRMESKRYLERNPKSRKLELRA